MDGMKTLKNVDVHFTLDDDILTVTISCGDDFFDFDIDVHEMMEMRYEKGIGQIYSSSEFDDYSEFLGMIQKILGNRLSYNEVMEKYFPKKKEESSYEKIWKVICPDCQKLVYEAENR
jgi:hypothetical protein